MTEDTRGPESPPPRPKNAPDLATSAASMALPQRFGPYVVERGIARGGMGAVLLVHHEQLGAPYALKVLPNAELDAGALVRFEREIQALSALSGHPHIVGVHACGIENGRPWYVMDRIEGDSLERILNVTGRLSIRAAVKLGIQMASALEAAHAKGVLHRDMKPGNVLVTGDLEQPEGRAVLVDFGLATDFGAGLTRSGEILGTPAFLSPEQALGERNQLGPHTDVFGLGAVLYYALTLERPFGRNSTSAVSALAAVLSDKLRMPRVVRGDIPEALEAILVRALEKEPARRYRRARDMAADLERCLARPEKQAPPRSSRKLLAGALALLALAGGAGGLAFHLAGTKGSTQAPPSPPVSPPPSSSRTPTDLARSELAAAIAAQDERRLAEADRLARVAGISWTPGDELTVGRAFVAKSPLMALRRSIAGRIPDEEEIPGLSDLLVAAAGPARHGDEDLLADLATEAARAGLEAGPLLARFQERLEADFTKARETGAPELVRRVRRLALALLSLRAREDTDVGYLRWNEIFKKPPFDDVDLDSRLDHDGPVNPQDHPDSIHEARLAVRRDDHVRAGIALENARAEGVRGERFRIAELEVLGLTRPDDALHDLGEPAPGETLSRRLLRARLLAQLARRRQDEPEHARKALAAYASIFEENVEAKDGHYVATNACLALMKLEHLLGHPHRARAWFGRARIGLQGGGSAFEEWWERLFPKN